jgi:Cellulose binding domain/Bacterial Ig domain/Calx-beta domain/Glycosyl hydrolases family 18
MHPSSTLGAIMAHAFEFSNRTERSGRRAVRTPYHDALEVRSLLSGVTATFAVTQDWGTGFGGSLTLTSTLSAPVANWKLEFDYAANIDTIWNAQIVSRAGIHYVITGASWDANLPANGVVSFGFNGSPGHTTAAPANYMLNGVPLNSSTPTPTLSISDVAITEPASGSAPAAFAVNLSAPATTPVTVHYNTLDNTAKAGADYTAASGNVTFAPGQTSQTIPVSVLADSVADGNETFLVVLSNPSGATLARAQASGTISDPPSNSGDVTFQVTSDWGSGFNGQITIKNSTKQDWTAWTLSFDFVGQITSIWDASVFSRGGNHFVIQNASYDGALAPGATVAFGFTGSRESGLIAPTNAMVRGGPPVLSPPTAVNDAAWTSPGTAVVIPVLANDSDNNGSTLNVVAATQGSHGSVAVNAGQTVTYTPAAGFTGVDSFSYTLGDGSGLTSKAAVTVTVSKIVWPARVFAPYVDVTLAPAVNLPTIAQTVGVKFFNLAFVVADSSNVPSWGGYAPYEINGGAFDQALRAQVNTLRGLGGDVAVSFGGANGSELATKITTVKALQSAYQSVIDAYGLTRIDFDIEGGAAADHASIDRRSQAMAALQATATAAGKPLQIWLTLPVLPTGLTADGLYVVQSALKFGVSLSGVNVMAMDYGDSAAPNPAGQMGTYAIASATSVFGQLKTLYGTSKTDAQIWAMIGVTPMIGLNDNTSEIFDQAAARQLLAFAQQKGMGEIAMWSLSRDQQNAAGRVNYVDPTSSSILQKPYEFSTIFLPFTA